MSKYVMTLTYKARQTHTYAAQKEPKEYSVMVEVSEDVYTHFMDAQRDGVICEEHELIWKLVHYLGRMAGYDTANIVCIKTAKLRERRDKKEK